jgi:hypothetical protein
LSSVPLIAALPQFNQTQTPDSLAASSPILQSLLANTGGNLTNVDSLAASQPGFAQALSLMSPSGGLSPQQGAQFGPLFGLIMSLMGGGQQQQQPTPGMGL